MKIFNFKKNKNTGVALLFAILITSVLFVIALGTTEIAMREANFSTSTKKANEAFFAADTGYECALYYDKDPLNFPLDGNSQLNPLEVQCKNDSNTPSALKSGGDNKYFTNYDFVIPDLNGLGSCAKVSVLKEDGGIDPNTNNQIIKTTIISKGYNLGDGECVTTDQNVVERELQVNY